MAAIPAPEAVLAALKVVIDPDLRRDIVSLGFVKNVAIANGRVSFTIELTTPACPVKDQLRDQAAAAVRALPGVSDVDVQMTASVRSVSAPETGRTPLPGVKNVIAVGAGKGGVGKTTVAVNLALGAGQVRKPRRHSRRGHLRTERAHDAGAPDAAGHGRQADRARREVRCSGRVDGIPDAGRCADHLARPDAPRRHSAVFSRRRLVEPRLPRSWTCRRARETWH